MNTTHTARSAAVGLAAAVAMSLTLAGGAFAQDASGTLQAVKNRGELRVAGPVYLPFVIQNPDGSYDGIDVSALGSFAESLGVELTMVPAGWDTVVAGITTDKWDIVPSLCVTPTRDEVIDYSNPYVDLKLTFYVKTDNEKGIETFEDLNRPDVVHVVATGSAGDETIRDRFPDAQVRDIPGVSDPEMVLEVLSGRADVAGTDWPVTMSVLNATYEGQLTFIPSDPADMISAGCPVAWGIVQGDTEWQTTINDFLAEFIESGEFEALNDEYFAPDRLNQLLSQ